MSHMTLLRARLMTFSLLGGGCKNREQLRKLDKINWQAIKLYNIYCKNNIELKYQVFIMHT